MIVDNGPPSRYSTVWGVVVGGFEGWRLLEASVVPSAGGSLKPAGRKAIGIDQSPGEVTSPCTRSVRGMVGWAVHPPSSSQFWSQMGVPMCHCLHPATSHKILINPK